MILSPLLSIVCAGLKHGEEPSFIFPVAYTLSHHFTLKQIIQLGIALDFLYDLGRFVAAFRIPL
jgi:hypothetical protein